MTDKQYTQWRFDTPPKDDDTLMTYTLPGGEVVWRVEIRPKTHKQAIFGPSSNGFWGETCSSQDRLKITFDVIDGLTDYDSVEMERI